ncbi:hypothetical protein BP5796_11335 [Neofusicoccum parvum]|nr:hypothetical protein BP5796_11335 [Neofusicoccum parvum]
MSTAVPSWQEIAARKAAQRDALLAVHYPIPDEKLPSPGTLDVSDIPRASGLLTPKELEITESTAVQIVDRIAEGELTALEVLLAVSKRAAVAQKLLNCISEVYFDQAIERAKELDDYYSREGKTIGPLHGLPISLKDQFNLKGVDTTVGYVAWANKPAAQNSTLVDLLAKAGAIFFVKTNVPATLMMGESINNVFGRTLHPKNRELSSGGSSGGESALVSFRGSFLGVGTDIGGSIRHPCSFTGLYGLRPSHGRVSYQRVANTFLGQEAVRSCAGPMCRSAADIRLFMAALAQQEPWLHDPQIVPLPWRRDEETLPGKLCFGFAMGDGVVTPTPPLRRAMEITRQKLLAAGHAVVEYIPYEHTDAAEIIHKMWSADAGQEFQRDTDASGEPLHPHLEAWLGRSAKKTPQTVFETWQNQHRRTALQTAWLERWQATAAITGTGRPIDGLIMPLTPFPAVRHDAGYPYHWGPLPPLLDLTTGVFPVTTVDLEKDVVPADWVPISDADKMVMEYYATPKNHENAPVGLAVIGRRLEEEKVTALLQVIGDSLSE